MTTREKLAEHLNKHIPSCTWNAVKMYPAQGAWRTNKMLDVWCWEATIVFKIEDGGPEINKTVGSYQTMTELLKCNTFEFDDIGELRGWIE